MPQATIFNTGAQSLDLIVNNGPAGQLAGTGPSAGYAPASLTLPYARGGGAPGQFGDQNQLLVRFQGGMQPQVYMVSIDPNQPLDVQLYIFSEHVVVARSGQNEQIANAQMS